MAQNPPVRIGVVIDGRSPRAEEYLETLKREVTTILEDEYSVSFPQEKILFGDWTLPGVSGLSDRLLNDPDIDIVVALGFISSQYVCGRKSFDKPTFASSVIDPALQQLPVEKRTVDSLRPGEYEEFQVSGIRNLNYLRYSGGSTESMRRFKAIIPFSKAAVLVMDALMKAMPAVDTMVAQLARQIQVETIIVPVADSIPEILSRIPEDTEVAFVTPLLNLEAEQMNELIAGLNARKLPTLSVRGRVAVEQGMLLSMYSTDDPITRSRRIALNIQEALYDRDPGEMSIEFERSPALVINMATARLLGISPRYSTLLEAELLNEEPQQFVRRLSLGAVVREASIANLDLAAADRTVAAAEESVNESRAPLLPQIGLSGSASLIDADRARTFPAISETEFSATLAARQLIYSDEAWANYSIEKSLRDLSIEERQQLQLDVILEAAASYIDLLLAQSVERIQKENLKLTRSNLQLASSRVEIGAANRVELFRWQSQIAANQRDVIDAEALKRQARIAVNRILNRPLHEVFDTVEASLNDPELVASFDSLTPYIDNPRGFALYSEFMASEALAASPEIRQLDASLRARNRDLTAAKRSFFIPQIDLSGSITPTAHKGAGSELPPGLNNTDWVVGLNATLPLFQGAGRFARVNRAQRQVEDLKLQREAVSLRVEQRIRSSLESANASFLGIELSQAQSRAAKENFDLVKDSYAAGVVGILQLLDAQNEALVAELSAANAVFRYLSDLMQAQRATGHFDYFRSPQERQDFLLRLDKFYRENGVVVRNP
jgi:outer membrane protein TolC